MDLNNRFLTQGLLLFDANISTKIVEISDNFRNILGEQETTIGFDDYSNYFDNSTKNSVYDMLATADIGTSWISSITTIGGKSWFKFEITNRYIDSTGYHHIIGIGRELSTKELNKQHSLIIDINLIMSIINDLQMTTSDKLFSKGIRQVLNSLNSKIPGINIAVLQYIEPNRFDIIDIAKSKLLDRHNMTLSIGSTIESKWINKCYTDNHPIMIEDISKDDCKLCKYETLFFQRNNFKAALLVPIKMPSNEVWGVIGITRNYPTIWQEKEVNNIVILANTIASSIRRNQLNNSLLEQIRQQHLACQVGKIYTWHWDYRKQITSNYIINKDGGIRVFDATSEDLKERANEEDMNLLKEQMTLINLGKSDSFRLTFRHRGYESNRMEWFDIIGEVTNRDYNGRPITLIGIARNIHEEMEHNIAKQEEMERQNAIYDNLPVGIEFFNASGLLTYSNHTIEKLYGISKTVTMESQYNIFNHSVWTDKDKSMIRENDNIDIVTRYDFGLNPFAPTFVSNRTDIAYFTHKISKLYEHGKFAGYMCVTIDTTESYLQKKQIKIFESYLSEIGLFAKLGVFWDNNSSIYTSEQWNINLGLPRNRKATLYDRDIDNVHLEDREQMESQYKALVEGYISSFQQDVRVLQFDGKLHWIRIFFTRNDSNEITGLSIEITQRKQNEQLLLKAKQKAERMDMLKSTFINNMSHEIRTPLNAIVGFSELLVMTENPAERAVHSEIIKTNNEHLLMLISDILDYSKLESNNMEYKYELIDIATLSTDIFERNNAKRPSDISYIIRPNTASLETFIDIKRTSQIVSNLISNAFKFTSKGTVEVWWEHNDNEITFHVKDSGIGISEDNISRIFDSFVKLDNFTIGTGLGLSICNVMAKQMGGSIHVSSLENKGSHFWLTLPIVSKNSYILGRNFNLKPHRQPKSVLIASNDQDTLDYMSYCLEDKDIMHFTRTEGFFPLWLEKKPWLTLLDIRLFGSTIMQYLPGLHQYSSTCKVLVLNYHQSGIHNDLLINAGVTHAVMMPTTTEDLKNIINSLM
jgi:signal transduction histidine kinase